MEDLPTFGLLFESLAVRDLRVYAQSVRAHLAHYRDSNELEVDASSREATGHGSPRRSNWAGRTRSTQPRRRCSSCAPSSMNAMGGAPANLVVITAVGYGYRRDDGVLVVPLATLGP